MRALLHRHRAAQHHERARTADGAPAAARADARRALPPAPATSGTISTWLARPEVLTVGPTTLLPGESSHRSPQGAPATT